MGNVLVTSISKKVPLLKQVKNAIIRTKLNIKLFGGDVDKNCIGRYFVDEFWEMKRLSELSIENLVLYCKENNISSIIPTRDGELQYFSKNKEILNDNSIWVMISNLDAVTNCLDKYLFYQKLKRLNYPVIQTATTIDLINSERYVVKEQFGAGSQDVGICLSWEEAHNLSNKMISPIYQPYIEGQEVSIDLYVSKDGKVKGVVPRKREKVVNGESQITTTFQNEKLEQMCSNLVEDLQIYGHVVLQVIIDPDHQFHIIECNSRFGGASTLSIEVGLDSFYWFLLESMEKSISDYPFVRNMKVLTLVRYPEDLIF